MTLLLVALDALEQLERTLLVLERWLAALITHPTIRLAHSTQAFLRQSWSQLTGGAGDGSNANSGPPTMSTAVVAVATRGRQQLLFHHDGMMTLPLLTLTLYGLSHYLRWISTAHAYGVHIPAQRKALVASLFVVLPNVLVPVVRIQFLHLLLIIVVAANNLFLYREYCIHWQLRSYGRRLPGEPLVMAVLQGIDAANEVVVGPGQVVARMMRPYLPQLLSLPPTPLHRIKLR